MKKSYTILAIVAIIAIIVYCALPEKRFAESVFPLVDNTTASVYDDNYDGGSSVVLLNLSDSLAKFQCTLGTDEKKPNWCGMIFNFDPNGEKNYHNWSFVDTIHLDIDIAGTDEFNLKIWAYDPDVTDLKNASSFRLLLKEIPVKQGRNKIDIPFEQFYIPDFWYDNLGVKRSLNRPHHESIARIEFSAGWKQPRGKNFVINVREITATGVSNTPYGIFLFIILGLMIIAIGRRHPVKETDEKK